MNISGLNLTQWSYRSRHERPMSPSFAARLTVRPPPPAVVCTPSMRRVHPSDAGQAPCTPGPAIDRLLVTPADALIDYDFSSISETSLSKVRRGRGTLLLAGHSLRSESRWVHYKVSWKKGFSKPFQDRQELCRTFYGHESHTWFYHSSVRTGI